MNAFLQRAIGSRLALGASLMAVLLMLACQRSPNTGRIAYLALTDGTWQVWLSSSDGSSARQLTDLKADVSRISWYSDGQALLVNMQDGRLFKVSVASGEAAALQAPYAGIQDAVISPDGKRAAFSFSPSGSVDAHDIWVVNLATREAAKLTSMPRLQHEPTWAHDGKSLYFLSGDGGQNHDIWRVDIATRKTEQLTVNARYHFDLAPRADGVIAYSGNNGGDYDLWLRQTDGSVEALTSDPELDARPSWAPDGKALLFESTRKGVLNIWRYDLDARQAQQVTQTKDGARQPAWAPVGASL